MNFLGTRRYLGVHQLLPRVFATQRRFRPQHLRHPKANTKLKVANCRTMDKFAYIMYGRHTRLRETHPAIAAEWDYERNPRHLHPAVVINTTVQPLWWKCAACGHGYCLPLDRRTLYGKGCPQCEAQTKRTNPLEPVDAIEGEVNSKFAPQR